MITEKIKSKFSEISDDILLLFDPEKEYEEELDAYKGDEFRILRVNNNYFRIKYEVEFRPEGEKILLYHPFSQPEPKEYYNYPITDLLLAGNILAIDEMSELMDRYQIPVQQKNFIASLKRWIKPKKNESRLMPFLAAKPFNENALASAVISIILDEKKTGKNTFNAIRIFELMNESEENWENKYLQIYKAGLQDKLLNQLSTLFSTDLDYLGFESLKTLFLKLKYNAITAFVPEVKSEDEYGKLRFGSEISKTKTLNFFKDWEDDKNKSKLVEPILENLGEEVNVQKIINIYGTDQEYGITTSKSLEMILLSAVEKLEINPSEIIQQYGSWKNSLDDYAGHEYQMEFLLNAAHFYDLRKRYSDFVFNKADDYLSIYSKELYRLDLYYRKAFIAYQKLGSSVHEKYSKVFDRLNKAYDQYLIDLNNPWVKELDELEFNMHPLKITKQFNFYKEFVKPVSTKKVVIISDAFRYELAQELAQELNADVNNSVSCKPMLSAIPSYTNLGMSNLLPNDGIVAEISEGKIDYSINGIKTLSTYREKILQNFDENTFVIDYATFSKFNQEQGRAYLKDKHTVYIYHNWMDSVGDKKASEFYTFESSEQCISQLHRLIKSLYTSLNITTVTVTADHGFLFNYHKISDATSQPFPAVKDILKEHTRFCITTDELTTKDTYDFSLANTTNIETNVKVIVPKAINRFRKKGNFGVQFVHGGCSLQEVVVPVLEFKRGRNDKAQDVPFVRIDQLKTITSGIVKLKFLQSEPVGNLYKPLAVNFGLYSIDNELISTEAEIDFNVAAENPTDRQFEIKLELTSAGSKQKVGYLKAFKAKEKDKLNTLVNDMIKINILELDDFS